MPTRLRILTTTPRPVPDDFIYRGKPVMFPTAKVACSARCGDLVIHLGHPWEGETPATLTILDGDTRRECIVPRAFKGQVMAIWLDGTTLSMVISDAFHVVHGIAIVEADVRGSKAKVGPLRRLRSAARHMGKGHAELTLQAVMRRGDQLFALAGAGTNRAVLELEPTGASYTARVLLLAKADQAVFSDNGDHVVLHQRGKTTTIVGLDGTRLATVTAPVEKGATSYLNSATPGLLAYTIFHANNERSMLEIATEPWPESTTHELAEVPASDPIANLPIELARACSPEPTSYQKADGAPAAFGAVIGWALNADPKTAKATVTHAILTDTILNFFAIKDRRLRFRFNFSVAAITAVTTKKLGRAVIVELATPSGRTVLHTTRELATALVDAVD